MQDIIFWKKWSKVERLICSASLFLLALLSTSILSFWYRGTENIVNWDILSELEDALVELDSSNNQQLINKAYLVKEQFVASKMIIEAWTGTAWLIIATLGISLILAAISALKRTSFIIGMMILIIALAFCHFEILQLFETDKPILLSFILIVYGGFSYYFNAFKEDVPVVNRILVFISLSFCIWLVTGFLVKSPIPAFTLSSYSIPVFVVCSLIFIVWLSFEIIAGLVYVVSNRKAGMAHNSLVSFIAISLLYLSSILLIYFKRNGQIESTYFTISPIFLIVLSVWLGLWGFRKRTEALIPFRAIGVWLYAGLSLILAITLCFVLATDNNPLIDLFETFFINTQLALGIAFVFYVGINFNPLFNKGYEVHKVLYKPLKFSLFQTWIIGGVSAILLFGLNGLNTFYQFQAGRNNLLGDLYTERQEYKLAEEYYKLALAYDFKNHKSNYALASLALFQGDNQTAGAYFRQAVERNASPQAFVGLSNTLATEGLFFDAIFNLRKGLTIFPKSGEIQNNLGYLYSKTNIVDSTYYYFNLALENSKHPEIPQTNLVGFFAKNPKIVASDFSKNLDYNSLLANELVLSTQKATLPKIDISIPPDSGLSVNNFAYLYNRAVFIRDTTEVPLLQKLETKSGPFYEELQTARAFIAYYNGNKINGLDLLASQVVADTSKKTILNRNTLNFWLTKEMIASENNLPKTASINTYQTALRQHPLDLQLLEKAVEFFNKNKQSKLGYEAILGTLRFRSDSPKCQEIYILQCLEMGYTEFARDGLNVLFSIASPQEYESFLKIYEAKKEEMIKKLQTF